MRTLQCHNSSSSEAEVGWSQLRPITTFSYSGIVHTPWGRPVLSWTYISSLIFSTSVVVLKCKIQVVRFRKLKMLSNRGFKNAKSQDIPWRFAPGGDNRYDKESNSNGVISFGMAENVRYGFHGVLNYRLMIFPRAWSIKNWRTLS